MNKRPSVRQLVILLILILFWPILMLLASGNWLWPEGWLFGGWYALTMGTIAGYIYFKDPALLAERLRKNGSGNQRTWDKHFIIAFRTGCMIWILIMPVDASRFKWSAGFPPILKLAGIIILPVASLLLFLSFRHNSFLSPHVRIQVERKHQLVTGGIYRIVRHPMYLSLLLMFTGVPLLLGSYTGLAMGILMSVFLGLRAVGEEKVLTEEFKQYASYKMKVRFRMIPLIW